ncbi:helix-turn-helix domain-containing protein [Novosphingobium lentum]|uniref:helix-turn-helix domain-containing protein n=1 Tax=Novosphingobium lentum TaxID=145287 RepID=UPI000832CF76|nr:helix-turn-helix domain-containing protein [Novosphingobium lentum]
MKHPGADRPLDEPQPTHPDAGDHTAVAAGTSDVHVRISPPPPPLEGYVTFSYVVEAAGPVSDFLYPEWGNVRFNLDGDMVAEMPGSYEPGLQLATLFGPTDRAATIRSTGGRIAGFGLTPLGWARFVARSARPLANRIRPLDGEFGVDPRRLREELIEAPGDDAVFERFDALLLAALAQTAPLRPVALRLDEVLRSKPTDVADFVRRMGTTSRTLHRECEYLFGFNPRRLLRRQRFLDALGQIRMQPDARFAELLDERYFDQSHFIRDFREFIGMTPREYLRTPRDIFRIAAAEQANRGITLSFRLPPPPTAVG